MLRYFCYKNKNKNSNCKNNCNTMILPETNYPCDNNSSKQCISTNQNTVFPTFEDLKKQSELYSIQANCAKEHSIDLRKQAKELEYKISCLYNESNEFWNQYEQLLHKSNIYMDKANCYLSETTTHCNCNSQSNCHKQNKCNSKNKPIVVCKKSGACTSTHGN